MDTLDAFWAISAYKQLAKPFRKNVKVRDATWPPLSGRAAPPYNQPYSYGSDMVAWHSRRLACGCLVRQLCSAWGPRAPSAFAFASPLPRFVSGMPAFPSCVLPRPLQGFLKKAK